MSKGIVLATLAALVALLLVMRVSLNKQTDPPPKMDQAAQREAAYKGDQAQRKQIMDMMKKKNAMIKQVRKGMINPVKTQSPDLTDNWYEHGKDGEAGLKVIPPPPAEPERAVMVSNPMSKGSTTAPLK